MYNAGDALRRMMNMGGSVKRTVVLCTQAACQLDTACGGCNSPLDSTASHKFFSTGLQVGKGAELDVQTAGTAAGLWLGSCTC